MTSFRILALATGLVVPLVVGAQDHGGPLAAANGVEITEGYAVSAGPTAPTGAAYMTITNTTASPDRLIAAEGDAARRIELHAHTLVDGVARMRPVEGGIDLPPGASVALERGGLHVMMMGLNAPLVVGETVDLTLVFETAGPIPVSIPIGPDGADAPAAEHGH